jgi:hypothetical protein
MEKIRMVMQSPERINVKILAAGAIVFGIQLKAKEI